eukprot:PLAT11933.1.p1 GENE.PLAT11933.1~~PLAT11933.1.p1  ORF type:complete len:1147 (-),score=522.20 PLAT11933.1:222-3395(-)
MAASAAAVGRPPSPPTASLLRRHSSKRGAALTPLTASSTRSVATESSAEAAPVSPPLRSILGGSSSPDEPVYSIDSLIGEEEGAGGDLMAPVGAITPADGKPAGAAAGTAAEAAAAAEEASVGVAAAGSSAKRSEPVFRASTLYDGGGPSMMGDAIGRQRQLRELAAEEDAMAIAAAEAAARLSFAERATAMRELLAMMKEDVASRDLELLYLAELDEKRRSAEVDMMAEEDRLSSLVRAETAAKAARVDKWAAFEAEAIGEAAGGGSAGSGGAAEEEAAARAAVAEATAARQARLRRKKEKAERLRAIREERIARERARLRAARELREGKAAGLLTRVVRGHVTRVAVRRHAAAFAAAVPRIQRAWRAHAAWMKERVVLDAAAGVIQRIVRRDLARKAAAASRIQALVRGVLQRTLHPLPVDPLAVKWEGVSGTRRMCTACGEVNVWTAVHRSAALGHQQCLEVMITRQFSLQGRDEAGRSAMFYAAGNGHLPCLALLLDYAPELLDVGDQRGNTPLHVAAMRDHGASVQLLLESAAPVDVLNAAAHTAMHLARSPAVLELLWQFGGSPYLLDVAGRSPLFFACATGRADCVRVLLGMDSDGYMLDVVDERGDTPLHAAACCGALPCVEALLQTAASPALLNSSGLTPSRLARLNGHADCLSLLLEYSGEPPELPVVSEALRGPDGRFPKWLRFTDDLLQRPYFFNTTTGLPQWAQPAEWVTDEQRVERQRLSALAKDSRLNRNYITLVEEYTRLSEFREKQATVSCTLCHKRTVKDMFLPCEHSCVCRRCIKRMAIGPKPLPGDVPMHHAPWSACVVCSAEIKSIVPLKNAESVLSRKPRPRSTLDKTFLVKFGASGERLRKYQPRRGRRSRLPWASKKRNVYASGSSDAGGSAAASSGGSQSAGQQGGLKKRFRRLMATLRWGRGRGSSRSEVVEEIVVTAEGARAADGDSKEHDGKSAEAADLAAEGEVGTGDGDDESGKAAEAAEEETAGGVGSKPDDEPGSDVPSLPSLSRVSSSKASSGDGSRVPLHSRLDREGSVSTISTHRLSGVRVA